MFIKGWEVIERWIALETRPSLFAAGRRGPGTLSGQAFEQGFELSAAGRLQVLDRGAGRADWVTENVEAAAHGRHVAAADEELHDREDAQPFAPGRDDVVGLDRVVNRPQLRGDEVRGADDRAGRAFEQRGEEQGVPADE